ncbi:MAG TPA: hypothetical protein VK075_06865 [Pseudogracilibacillus sp.]|nr:hypothetical protein [Pseudogracilibacillus sp.]
MFINDWQTNEQCKRKLERTLYKIEKQLRVIDEKIKANTYVNIKSNYHVIFKDLHNKVKVDEQN